MIKKRILLIVSPVLPPVTTAEQSTGLHLVTSALFYFLVLWKQNAQAQRIFKKFLNYSACLRLQDKSDFNFSVKMFSTIENPSERLLLTFRASCTAAQKPWLEIRSWDFSIFLWVTILPQTSITERVLLKCSLPHCHHTLVANLEKGVMIYLI